MAGVQPLPTNGSQKPEIENASPGARHGHLCRGSHLPTCGRGASGRQPGGGGTLLPGNPSRQARPLSTRCICWAWSRHNKDGWNGRSGCWPKHLRSTHDRRRRIRTTPMCSRSWDGRRKHARVANLRFRSMPTWSRRSTFVAPCLRNSVATTKQSRVTSRALAIKPDFAEALNNLGAAQQSLNRFEEALISLERALAIRPRYAEALYNRGARVATPAAA